MGINWFRDSLGMIDDPAEISTLAASVTGSSSSSRDEASGVYFVSVGRSVSRSGVSGTGEKMSVDYMPIHVRVG